MTYEITQMKNKLDDMNNKIHRFSEEMDKVRTERHKLKTFNESMEKVDLTIREFKDQMRQLSIYSADQHRRLRHIEDHLGVSRHRQKTKEIKNVPTT